MTEKIVQISLPSDILAMVQAEADKEQMPISAIITDILAEYFEWLEGEDHGKREGSYIPK